MNHKNIIDEIKAKFNKRKHILTPIKTNNRVLKTRKQKDKEETCQVNSINYYHDGMKKFRKYNKKLNNKMKKGKLFEESSDSSINDNGQEEILKKIISLNYPVLSETIEEKKTENKNNLLYLRNLFEEDKKEEHQKKIFVQNSNDYINYYVEKKRKEIDNKKKYVFLKGKNKYILIRK